VLSAVVCLQEEGSPLNEVQEQHRTLEAQQAKIDQQTETIDHQGS
jgi:hypothetical protein